MDLNYSIIIPHKDIPDLLQRCLDSIPVRDDIEVIVVDDNSDPRKVDFEHFPQWKGNNYQYFFTKEGRGTGYARNIGLDCAQGRWIVFADADDFFTEDFNGLLDEMAEDEADVFFFSYRSVLSDDISQKSEEHLWPQKCIARYLNGDKSDVNLRISFDVPWCRLIRRELIKHHNIRFSVVRWGNDVFFSGQIGYYAKTIKASATVGYVITTRAGSITYNMLSTAREFRVRTIEKMKCDALFKDVYGPHAVSKGWLSYSYRKKGFWGLLWFCVANVFHPRVFWRTALFLTKLIVYKMKKTYWRFRAKLK